MKYIHFLKCDAFNLSFSSLSSGIKPIIMNHTRRRSFFKVFLASITTLGFGLPLLARAKPLIHPHGEFMHVVYFWLASPDDTASRHTFLNNMKSYLDKIHVIKTKYIGIPVASDRSVVDSSYTFSLIVTFNDNADQEIYQSHPAHVDFVENNKSMWEKVVVYDSIPA